MSEERAEELHVDVEDDGQIVMTVRTSARVLRLVLPTQEARKLGFVLLASSQPRETT